MVLYCSLLFFIDWIVPKLCQNEIFKNQNACGCKVRSFYIMPFAMSDSFFSPPFSFPRHFEGFQPLLKILFIFFTLLIFMDFRGLLLKRLHQNCYKNIMYILFCVWCKLVFKTFYIFFLKNYNFYCNIFFRNKISIFTTRGCMRFKYLVFYVYLSFISLSFSFLNEKQRCLHLNRGYLCFLNFIFRLQNFFVMKIVIYIYF